MKPSLVAEAVKECVAADITPIIWGAPGCGKTQVIEQTAAAIGYECIKAHPAVDDPVDWKGLPMPSGDGVSAEFRPYGNLLRCLNASKPTIVFLDDLGQSPQSVQAALMQVIHGRELNGQRISDLVRFVAASNRETDRAYVQRLITPIANRCVHFDYEIDHNDWANWALGANLPIETIAFIRFRSNLLHQFDPHSKEKAFPSPRSWEFASRITTRSINPLIEYEVYKGIVGEAAAAEYVGFLKIFRELPNPDAVIMSPATADVPQKPDVLYALAGALAKRAGENNFDRILEYGKRIPVEFCILMVRDIVKLNSKLQNTKAFINFSTQYQDVLI
jgi:MoxR-like ATPase